MIGHVRWHGCHTTSLDMGVVFKETQSFHKSLLSTYCATGDMGALRRQQVPWPQGFAFWENMKCAQVMLVVNGLRTPNYLAQKLHLKQHLWKTMCVILIPDCFVKRASATSTAFSPVSACCLSVPHPCVPTPGIRIALSYCEVFCKIGSFGMVCSSLLQRLPFCLFVLALLRYNSPTI